MKSLFWRTAPILFLILALISTSCEQEMRYHGDIEVYEYDSIIDEIRHDSVYLQDGTTVGVYGINSGKRALVLMINHAETDTIGMDPGLDKTGHERADRLSGLFERSIISDIFMTHFRRTYLTALPLVKSQEANVYRYEPDNQDLFSEILLAKEPKLSFVVGHETTIPRLLGFLLDGESPDFKYNSNDYIIIGAITNGTISALYKFKY